MLKFQVFLLVCLPFIAKAVFIPVNNDENPFYGSQYTSFPLQPAYNLQRSSYNQPQSRLIPLPGFGNIGNLLFPNKLTLSDIFQLKRTIKNLDTIIPAIRSEVQMLQMQVQTIASELAAFVEDQRVTCPTGYTVVEGSCYLFQTPPATFVAAKSTCEGMSNGFLALPELSETNDAFGVNIAEAFPESTANPFFIGVRSVDDAGLGTNFVLRDLDENLIANGNPRFTTPPSPAAENIGVFVTILASNPGGWTTTLAVDALPTLAADVTMAYLCQTNPI